MTRRRAMHAHTEQGDTDSSAQSLHKEAEPSEISGLASNLQGNGFMAKGTWPRERNLGVGDDDARIRTGFRWYWLAAALVVILVALKLWLAAAVVVILVAFKLALNNDPVDVFVYGFAFIVMVILPQAFRILWPSYMIASVLISGIGYHAIKAFYGQSAQEYLHGLDANTVSESWNLFKRAMYAVKANNTDFYGPTVGQNTKWSSAFSLFYTNAILGSAWRLGRMGWKHRNDEASMKSLAVVVLLQQLLHMGLVRMHSTIRVNVRAAAEVAWEVIMNVRRARHAQVFSLSIVGGGIHVFLLLLERDGTHVLRFLKSRFNLIAKFCIDHVWYCLRLFLVDDPMLHLVGRRGEDSKLVEMCALHHLMEAMFGDLVLTVVVAFTPQMFDAWAEADLFVQIGSMMVLGYVSLNKTIPLQLEREGLNARNIGDFLLKCVVIGAHATILYHRKMTSQKND